jgi:hypothetical protein
VYAPIGSNVTVNRAQPLTITWSGGDANGYVDIEGSAQGGPSNGYTVSFDCAAPTTAGHFTIPPSILMAMPPGPNAMANIQVSTFAYPFTLGTASGVIPGFDAALNLAELQTSVVVIFQ